MGLALLSNVFLSLKLSPLGSLESIFKLLCSFIVIVLAAHRLRVGEIWVRGSRKYISPPAKSTRSLWTGSPDDRFMRPARAGGGGGGVPWVQPPPEVAKDTSADSAKMGFQPPSQQHWEELLNPAPLFSPGKGLSQGHRVTRSRAGAKTQVSRLLPPKCGDYLDRGRWLGVLLISAKLLLYL